MSKRISKDKSETLYNKFMDWREKILQLHNVIIVIEGKRDLEVLEKLGVQLIDNLIITYSQKSMVEIEELLTEEPYKNMNIIPLLDFDRQGEEYMKELEIISNKIDMELRMELRNLTRGKLQEFEDLLYLLKSRLHPSYWLILCQTLNIPD